MDFYRARAHGAAAAVAAAPTPGLVYAPPARAAAGGAPAAARGLPLSALILRGKVGADVDIATGAIVSVAPASQALTAGVRVGDVVVGVNGESIEPTALVRALAEAGRPCTLNLRRPPFKGAGAVGE